MTGCQARVVRFVFIIKSRGDLFVGESDYCKCGAAKYGQCPSFCLIFPLPHLQLKNKPLPGINSGAACLLVVVEKQGYCRQGQENKSVPFSLTVRNSGVLKSA